MHRGCLYCGHVFYPDLTMTQYQTTDHHPRLGIEVHSGLDLKSLTSHQQSHLKNTLWQHGVAVCRNQHFTAEELEQFAADTFGPLMFGGSRDKNAELPSELISRHVAILGNPSGPIEKPPESVACQWHHDKDALPLFNRTLIRFISFSSF